MNEWMNEFVLLLLSLVVFNYFLFVVLFVIVVDLSVSYRTDRLVQRHCSLLDCGIMNSGLLVRSIVNKIFYMAEMVGRGEFNCTIATDVESCGSKKKARKCLNYGHEHWRMNSTPI